MPFVTYRFLEDEGIMPNRMTLARSIAQLDFPKPVELGKNRIAWDLGEVRAWLASRPRRMPRTGARKASQVEATDSHTHSEICDAASAAENGCSGREPGQPNTRPFRPNSKDKDQI
jgi:Prophage CP4-57 regulatory protein (AlpA)